MHITFSRGRFSSSLMVKRERTKIEVNLILLLLRNKLTHFNILLLPNTRNIMSPSSKDVLLYNNKSSKKVKASESYNFFQRCTYLSGTHSFPAKDLLESTYCRKRVFCCQVLNLIGKFSSRSCTTRLDVFGVVWCGT